MPSRNCTKTNSSIQVQTAYCAVILACLPVLPHPACPSSLQDGVARDARDLFGAGGISVESSPVRHMLNLKSVITYEGTESIHQIIVGRELTEKAAF